jgi:mannitol/fructose-specific phosphotransferase system IIA component (Ntr-type)
MAGVALGDSQHLHRKTRATLDHFVSFVFAPIFFASIGLRVDFLAKFHLPLVVVVFAVACFGKVVGAGLGARLSGLGPRESLAVGFGLNARGAMEIILALLALHYQIIRERMFVALVVTALATSVMSGPMIQWLLRRKKPRRLTQHLALVRPLAAATATEAIAELCGAIAGAAGIAADTIKEAVLEREAMMPTGLEGGVAVPHAPIKGLASPVVGVGVAADGIDFGAIDGDPSRLIFLLLTPEGDHKAQLEILADIAKTFSADVCKKALHARSLPEFLALAKAEAPAETHEEAFRPRPVERPSASRADG